MLFGVSSLRLGDFAPLRLRWAQIERRDAETQRREGRGSGESLSSERSDQAGRCCAFEREEAGHCWEMDTVIADPAAAPNPARASRLQVVARRRGVGEPCRWANLPLHVEDVYELKVIVLLRSFHPDHA